MRFSVNVKTRFTRFRTTNYKTSRQLICADNCDIVRICSLRGQSVTLTWTSANASASSGAGKGFSPSGVSGSLAVSPGATITCTGAGGSASRTFRASIASSRASPLPCGSQPAPSLSGGQGEGARRPMSMRSVRASRPHPARTAFSRKMRRSAPSPLPLSRKAEGFRHAHYYKFDGERSHDDLYLGRWDG